MVVTTPTSRPAARQMPQVPSKQLVDLVAGRNRDHKDDQSAIIDLVAHPVIPYANPPHIGQAGDRLAAMRTRLDGQVRAFDCLRVLWLRTRKLVEDFSRRSEEADRKVTQMSRKGVPPDEGLRLIVAIGEFGQCRARLRCR